MQKSQCNGSLHNISLIFSRGVHERRQATSTLVQMVAFHTRRFLGWRFWRDFPTIYCLVTFGWRLWLDNFLKISKQTQYIYISKSILLCDSLTVFMLDAWIVNIWWLGGTGLMMLESYSKRLWSLQSPIVGRGKHHWFPMCQIQRCKSFLLPQVRIMFR